MPKPQSPKKVIKQPDTAAKRASTTKDVLSKTSARARQTTDGNNG